MKIGLSLCVSGDRLTVCSWCVDRMCVCVSYCLQLVCGQGVCVSYCLQLVCGQGVCVSYSLQLVCGQGVCVMNHVKYKGQAFRVATRLNIAQDIPCDS